jgi:hypothetical protein
VNKRSRFRDAFFASESFHASRWFRLRPDRRQMKPAVGAGSITIGSESRSPHEAKRNPGTMIRLFAQPRITLRFIRATRTKEKESGTPKDAVAPTSAPSGAATR